MTKPLSEPHRGRHRRIARHRPRGGARLRRGRRARHRRSPARKARSRNSTTRSAPRARPPRWCRSNLKDFDAIDRLGAAIHERWGKLDILLGNAGILGELAPLTHLDQAVWDEVMAVNVTANWRLIRSLDPLLRASDAGRAIFVTSGAARKATPIGAPIGISKAALEALVRTYAAETVTTPVKVMLVNPGPLRTRMRRAAMPGEDPMTLKTPEDLAPHIVDARPALMDRDRQDLRFPATARC